MNEDSRTPNETEETAFSRQVGAEAARKLKARAEGDRTIWFGLGMSGLIGWSVAVPTLVGAAIGIWVDGRYPGPFSWTLMLLLGGLIVGCLNAWHWVDSESKQMDGGSR